MSDGKRCILVFGGTFDPPHLAHTRLPALVADQLGCEQILYIPARLSPLKQDIPPTPAAHRLAMLTLALEDVPNASIETLELEREGPSYTIDTMRELDRRYGDEATLRLLIGADQALTFDEWKDWRELLDLADPVVMLRPPWNEAAFEEALRERYDPEVVEPWMARIVHVPLINVEATTIRERLIRGESVEGMIDPAVAAYIQHNNLYRTHHPNEAVQPTDATSR